MSSVILPKIEVTKSSTALIGLIFTLWLLLLSWLEMLPNLTNSGSLFGVIFLTLITTTVILSFIDIHILGRIQEWMIGSSPWVDNKIDLIRRTKEFKDLRDSRIAELLLGGTLIVIGILLLFEGANLFTILIVPPSGSEQGLSLPNINWWGLVIVTLGIFTIGLSFRRTRSQIQKILCLIWYNNIRRLSTQDTSTHDLVKHADSYIRTPLHADWEGFQIEYKTKLLTPLLKELKQYRKTLNTIKLTDSEISSKLLSLNYGEEKS